MLKYLCLLAGLTAPAALSGCNFVTVPHPVGMPIDDEEGKKLDGTWDLQGDTFEAKYIGQGRLIVASLFWDEEQECFAKQEVTVTLTRLNDETYAWLPNEQSIETEQYFFARYEFKKNVSGWKFLQGDGRWRFWAASGNEFEKAIQSGELEGTVQKGRLPQVVVTASPEALAQFLEKHKDEGLFEKEELPLFKRR